ncbi:MAG: hypothetical protein ACTHZX_10390, partial [Microbacterium sp.]
MAEQNNEHNDSSTFDATLAGEVTEQAETPVGDAPSQEQAAQSSADATAEAASSTSTDAPAEATAPDGVATEVDGEKPEPTVVDEPSDEPASDEPAVAETAAGAETAESDDQAGSEPTADAAAEEEP